MGIANSRMKDFFDLYILAEEFDFDGETLVGAIGETFDNRKTRVPVKIPIALTDEFAQDEAKRTQWSAFIRKSSLKGHGFDSLPEILVRLRAFLLPPLMAAGK